MGTRGSESDDVRHHANASPNPNLTPLQVHTSFGGKDVESILSPKEKEKAVEDGEVG